MTGKPKSKEFAHHANEARESRWRHVQSEDGALYVEQEADYPDIGKKERSVPINDFLREGPAGPPRELQKLIDRMFDD